MNQPQPKRIRRSAEFDEILLRDVKEMAEEKNWSFSYTCFVLLQSAIREKQRKRKIRAEDNTDDPRQGHAE